MIPVFDAAREFEASAPELMAAAERVLRSGRYILGPEVAAFEDELAGYLQVPQAVGVGSGTDALILALRALGVGPGDRVVTPAFSFFASAGAILNVGACPILVDIDPTTFCIDAGGLAAALTRHAPVKAIVVVHLYGQCAEMEAIMEVAGEHGALVLEDTAQALGATWRGTLAGTTGHVGCLSFFPTKNLGAFGDGGAVVSSDEAILEKVRLLRAHGAAQKYVHEVLGTNSRLDALQAALLRVRLPQINDGIARRREHAASYAHGLASCDLTLPSETPGRRHTWHQYTLRVRDRDRFRDRLAKAGIETAVHYPMPLHQQGALRHLGHGASDFPAAVAAAKEVVSLPMFPSLTAGEIDRVVDVIREGN